MILNDNLSERVEYSFRDYRAVICTGKSEIPAGFSDLSHWHEEIELLYILKGEISYNVNGEVCLLREGTGIFVNSKQLHFGFSDKAESCEHIVLLLHPDMLCPAPELRERFVTPLLEQRGLAYRLLEDRGWQGEILALIRQIFELRGTENGLLLIQSCFYRIWSLLFEHRFDEERPAEKDSHQVEAMRRMLALIRSEYAGELSLRRIAEAGNISESLACRLFRGYVNTTPMAYVTEWRIRKSAELLRQTDVPITQIGCAVGFGDSSYFTKVFRRTMGCTPKEYRRNQTDA